MCCFFFSIYCSLSLSLSVSVSPCQYIFLYLSTLSLSPFPFSYSLCVSRYLSVSLSPDPCIFIFLSFSSTLAQYVRPNTLCLFLMMAFFSNSSHSNPLKKNPPQKINICPKMVVICFSIELYGSVNIYNRIARRGCIGASHYDKCHLLATPSLKG